MIFTNTDVQGYIAPDIEILSIAVESGFAASFGDEGEAGAGGDDYVDNFGDF